MKNTFTALIVALLLFVAGGVCWTLAAAQDRLARLDTRVVTMDFASVDSAIAEISRSAAYVTRIPRLAEDIGGDANHARAIANYWSGQYTTLPLRRDAGGVLVERDPQLLLLAANAAYRAMRLDPTNRQASVHQLETVVKNYADVVKSSPDLVEAAYNYEFTSRALSVLEHARPGLSATHADAQPRTTIHGQPGKVREPPKTDMFKTIVPKQSDERTDQLKGGEGKPKARKG